MHLFAEAAKKHAVRYGRHLDYSKASCEDVAKILNEIAEPGIIEPDTPEMEEQLWTPAKMYGAYLGEVVCRRMHGTWLFDQSPDGGVHAVIAYGRIRFKPLERVYRRLTEDEYAAIGGTPRYLRWLEEHADNET